MSVPLLEFHQVGFRYPNTPEPVLRDCSFTLEAGRKVALLGLNGSGKSTLFYLAAALYRRDRGEIYCQGQRLVHQPQRLRQWRQRIGLAFQDPEQQLVAATVAEDISYGLCNLGLSPPEVAARLHQTLQEFDLVALADRPLHHLSLGQKRRVALAGVMALAPTLLLLDEPTTYLDYQQRQQLRELLEKIHQQGTTIVIATHDLDFAYGWADWIMILVNGQVSVSDRASHVFGQWPTFAPELGTPTLLGLWQQLPPAWRQHRPFPRTVTEFSRELGERFRHLGDEC
ncbi:energy-coupling factor ABC transporter ATP-binding protein [Thermosynechococcus vestitus]|uniref:Putative ABC transporter ATP-binding protein tll2439 n=1 Tax=Thermosynechococcus vestitus (strain NIES-2133 / IAM M-273 / BP-1) TaxID=197221 RepID=Y2439_THEVB|nr:ABC transporter ATP-binding protein [Thermosynechococcus vestitus]Q8DG84.1 RecName: Full=Putative ABC transporter ATP-binding protein tll2439 [Thermosynechococcus vestitus BP-1]BAC09991.1 ATP-binding protein of cobalt ABC transporter [Thermosynechococcus vestitus BP-1]